MKFVCLLTLVCIAGSCADAKEIRDPDYAFGFTVDQTKWKPAPYPVATLGEPVAVLTNGPQSPAIVVVFVRSQDKSEPVTEARLRSISQRLARVAAAAGAKVVTNEAAEIAGRKAISLRISGPGTGISIGGGDTPTMQHWLVFPRGHDLIVFQVTAANAKFDEAYESLRSMAESAKFDEARSKRKDPTFDDEDIGLSIAYPKSPWIRGGYELGDMIVPGYSLRIWSAPSSSAGTADGESTYANRLAMFLQFPGRAFSAQQLLDISVPGLTQTGAKVITKEVRTIAGKEAMWLLVEGKSKTGSNLSGQGNVATRQLWVAIPRVHNGNHNIVVFLFNAPAADYDQQVKEFEAMLKTLSVESD